MSFFNICRSAAVVGEYEWAGHFREHYIDNVSTDSRENALALSAAFIAMETGDFRGVRSSLDALHRPGYFHRYWEHVLGTRSLIELYIADNGYGPVLQSKLRAYYQFTY
ncbi:MAG: hypothetical protein AAGB22_15150, partial [Bacteroidota bacterium]